MARFWSSVGGGGGGSGVFPNTCSNRPSKYLGSWYKEHSSAHASEFCSGICVSLLGQDSTGNNSQTWVIVNLF